MAISFTIAQSVWPENAQLIQQLRETVFVIEQGVDKKIEWDGRDHLCLHAIAFSDTNIPIATGRILPSGHIGRIAVLASWRSQSVGTGVLNKLIEVAKQAKLEKVYLNSQTHALAFYQRFGFISEGPVFMEAGIPHQRMTRLL
jgi:predicted GNAT family N-acyltransferase